MAVFTHIQGYATPSRFINPLKLSHANVQKYWLSFGGQRYPQNPPTIRTFESKYIDPTTSVNINGIDAIDAYEEMNRLTGYAHNTQMCNRLTYQDFSLGDFCVLALTPFDGEMAPNISAPRTEPQTLQFHVDFSETRHDELSLHVFTIYDDRLSMAYLGAVSTTQMPAGGS